MDLGLKGKTVIVTGGGSNIGKAISLAFAAEGSNIVIADIDERQANKLADEIRQNAGKCLLVKTNVAEWDSVQEMIQKTLSEYKKIDVLVNNVGWTYDRLFVEKPRSEWVKEIDINLWGTINCIRAVVDHMIEQKGGKIISIGSDGGRMGEYKEVVYSAAKGGIIAMSKALARELGRYNINVNVVCPGVTVPEMLDDIGAESMWSPVGTGSAYMKPEVKEDIAKRYPLRRLGRPSDIASAVVFLSSDVANFITGQTLSVSGGYSMM